MLRFLKRAGFDFAFAVLLFFMRPQLSNLSTFKRSFRHSPLLIRLGNFTGPCYIRRVRQNTNGAIGTRECSCGCGQNSRW
jgi:hypothetical protein